MAFGVPGMQRDEQKRGAKRDSLFMRGELARIDGRQIGSIRIRNLSATGLMADCDATLQTSNQVAVTLPSTQTVSATVTWVGKGKIGLHFDEAIDPQAVRRPVVSRHQSGDSTGGTNFFKLW